MNSLTFIKQYFFKPRTVGAILPSSKYLAQKMVKTIDFENARYIAEYGPGTGVFTKLLLTKRNPDTRILLIERDESFYAILKDKYGNEPNVYIINDSAEHIGKLLSQYDMPHADYIISGLPFASLPQNVSSNILEQTKDQLHSKGEFITFQYTLLKKDFIGKYFNKISVTREFRNVPPAYVLCCRN